MDWRAFDCGNTLGERGSENGVILLDEEHPVGARITLERSGNTAPFSITCGVYGALLHARFFRDEAEAQGDFTAMKARLADMANISDEVGFNAAAKAFLEQFP